MRKISAAKFIEGVNSIYVEAPVYQEGHDGSDGKCDCIGMVRGGLKRGGATDVEGLGGTNYAARHTIMNLQKIKKASQLRKGDVVLKVRDKDDKNMPLPDKYRKGKSDYSSTWGETNFTHIGTVTREAPNLEITHMTSPTAKMDTSLGNWTYFGQLPWIDDTAEEDPETEWVRVYAENGKPVKMRQKPSSMCRIYWEVPSGSQVILLEKGETWSAIMWAGRSGYMMNKFLRSGEQLFEVTISGISKSEADALVMKYPSAKVKEE